jgi:hypothetical protein
MGDCPARVPQGAHNMRDAGQFCASLHSAALCALDIRLQTPRFRRTPELRFRALLTEDATWHIELVRA